MKLIFLLIFIISSSFAISIDKSWYDNTNENLEKIYIEQSSKISATKSNLSVEGKEQVEYQLLLLKKLLNLLKPDTVVSLKDIAQIDSIEDYIKKIKDYIKINSDYLTKTNEYEVTSKKIEILEEQLDKLTDKNDIQSINSQLLYAFYTLKNKQNKVVIEDYVNYLKDFKKKLLDGLDTIKITPTETLASEKTKIENTYTQILKDEKKLFLSLDKANISENESRINSLNNELNILKAEKIKITENFYRHN